MYNLHNKSINTFKINEMREMLIFINSKHTLRLEEKADQLSNYSIWYENKEKAEGLQEKLLLLLESYLSSLRYVGGITMAK